MTEGQSVIDELVEFISKYVILDEGKILAVALWVAHTHCFLLWDQSPYLAITSPEKECGKSRLLEVLECIVARPWMAIQPSEAVVFRKIDSSAPTLLLDETDAIFNAKSAEYHEGLRALLNAGNRNGATVPRCVGPSNKLVDFKVFCPKALAGIGTLPETVAGRSIPLRLERKRKDQEVARFRMTTAHREAEALVVRLTAWIEQAIPSDPEWPDMPQELSDRMEEGCVPLVTIADAAGCGERARAVLVELCTGERLDSDQSLRQLLLSDVRTVFDTDSEAKALSTTRILAELCKMDESPWEDYYGRGLESRDLAAILKPYGVHSTTVRAHDKDGKPAKGYKRDDLYDLWARYLPQAPGLELKATEAFCMAIQEGTTWKDRVGEGRSWKDNFVPGGVTDGSGRHKGLRGRRDG